MRRSFFLLMSLCLAGLVVPARASTISAGEYSLTDVSVDGHALTGDLTFNDSGYVTAATITFEDAAFGDPTFSSVNSTGFGGWQPVADFAYIAGANGQLALYYLPTLTTDGNIQICLSGVSCNGYQASYAQVWSPNLDANLTGGTIDPAVQIPSGPSGPSTPSPTPEPSSVALLGTGVLSVTGLARRRVRRRG
jgi:hypothetical protein